MKNQSTNTRSYVLSFLLTMLCLGMTISCNDFVNTSFPRDQVSKPQAFSNDDNLTSTVRGAYASFNEIAASYDTYEPLFADELVDPNASGILLASQNNSYTPQDAFTFFSGSYKTIYDCNAIIEALKTPSKNLSSSTVNRANAESKFLRAFSYFNLVNLYGSVPLVTSTNSQKTSLQPNAKVDSVYQFIEKDLTDAKSIIPDAYPTSNRFRVNKQTVNTLLAKVYLYQKAWKKAESNASSVINSKLYSLDSDLSNIFIAGSNETIWQLYNQSGYTIGYSFLVLYPTYVIFQARSSLVNAFLPGDKRKKAWLGAGSGPAASAYFPFKYQSTSSDDGRTEYLIEFRLAQLYLIRAEARAEQGDLAGAKTDINIIRTRAGLPKINSFAAKQAALKEVRYERRVELMFENGIRWFDLKRWGLAQKVLSKEKDTFPDRAVLLPIPQSAIEANPNLTQNKGY